MTTATPTRPTMTIDDLPTIGLDELVAEAALLTRIDRKYVLPRAVVPRMLELAAASTTTMRALEIDGSREFGYRSVYLDTDDLVSYRSAGQGRRRRFKIRSRSYLDTGTTWLEVKVRGPRGATIKERTLHHDVETAPLTAEGRAFVIGRLAAHALDPSAVARLRPTLVTAYRRSTLHLSEGGRQGRATIDTALEWSSLGQTGRDLDRPALAIVETKAGATPTALDRTLWRLGHRPVRMSKYGAGLAALRPDLPHLKWHRVLTHQLTPRRNFS